MCSAQLGDPCVEAVTCHLWTTAIRDALQVASSKRRQAETLFPFSVLNLSGLILVHTGESVLSELAFVPGKKKKKQLKKKKEGNKHPLKSPFGSKGGKNNQADVSCGPAT